MKNNFLDRKIDIKDIDKLEEPIRNLSLELLGPLNNKDVERQEKIFNFIFTILPKIAENLKLKPDYNQIKTFISNSKKDLRLANNAFSNYDNNSTVFIFSSPLKNY